MSEFIAFYTIDRKSNDTKLCERGFIKKASIDFVAESEYFKDYYFTNLSIADDEALYIKKTDIDVEVEKQDNHWEQDFKTFKTIKQCINLLSTDGKGTKQQVKEKLEELIKDAKD